MRRLVLAALVLGSAACTDETHDITQAPAPSFAAAARDSLAPLFEMDNPDRIAGEYLVRFHDDERDAEGLTKAIVAAHGGRSVAVWKGLKGFWGRLPDQAVVALRRNPRVRYIEANTRVRPAAVQSIAYPYDNWALDRIDQLDNPKDGKYVYDYDGTGVHIWILDTGVNPYVSELSGRVDLNSYVSYNGTDPFNPCYDHGTPVAVMAAGSVHGVAKNATIHVARVSDDCTNGTFSNAAVSSALEFIGDYAARPAVVNYSAGRQCGTFGCGFTTEDAVRYAISKGVQVVIAAGNDGNNACDYTPARVSGAITVGATDSGDNRVVRWGDPAPWASNYGSCLDLFAPGYGLADHDGSFSGTSGAAPLVAGVAALYLQQQPSASPAAVTQWILSNTSNGTVQNVGTGSPNKLLHSRPALAAPTVYGLSTNPAAPRQYNPFTLTINGSGFDPATVQILISRSECGPDYDTGCVSITQGSSITTKTGTQLVIQSLVLSMAGTKSIYVRNGTNGHLSSAQQITVNPL